MRNHYGLYTWETRTDLLKLTSYQSFKRLRISTVLKGTEKVPLNLSNFKALQADIYFRVQQNNLIEF